MQSLNAFLDELHHYTTVQGPLVSDSLALASDLRSYLQEVSENDLGMCSSLLFQSPNSLLNFLLKSTQNKELAKTKEEILDLILEYIKKIGPKGIQIYAISIIDTCFSVFRSDQTSKVKVSCLPPIMKLISLKLSTLTADSLRVQNKIEILLTELSYTKNGPTIKGNILQALGLFAEYFPELLVAQSRSLLGMICDLLTSQFLDKKPDREVIKGGMKGLTSLLVHFSADLTSDPTKIARVWRFILACLNPPEGITRYDIPKAGLQMIEKHAEIFKQYLTDKANKVYPLIKGFCTHPVNRYIRKDAFPAMEAFLLQVSKEIISPDRSREAHMETLRYFFEEFWGGLQEKNSGMLASSIFVRGLGIFARAIDFYMGPTEVKKLLHKLVVFSDRLYSAKQQDGSNNDGTISILDTEETIEHMPSIITAFANIIAELPAVDESCIDTLERIIGTFFLVYPQLYELQRQANYKAVSRLFLALYPKGASLRNLLTRVVFKGLTLTCSKPIQQLDNSQQNDIFSNTTTDYFFEYQDLWKNMIDLKNIPELDISPEYYKNLSAIVYKELIQSILKILKKLDLRYSVVKESELNEPFNPIELINVEESAAISITMSVRKSQVNNDLSSSDSLPSSLPSSFGSAMNDQSSLSQESQSSQTSRTLVSEINKNDFQGCSKIIMPGESIKPWVPKDFEIFLHLVEFVKLLLPSVKPSLFSPWTYIFCKEVISKANDYPLVSGLYKLFGVALMICSKISYFEGIGHRGLLLLPKENEEVEKSAENTNESNTSNEKETKRLCFVLITKFVRELLHQFKQYRDELLASCIQMILSVPKEFLDIKMYTPCLVRAFKMGLGFLPLTDIGLTALDSWLEDQPYELESSLHKILPTLNAYLYISKEDIQSNMAANERFGTVSTGSSWVFGYGGNRAAASKNSSRGKDLAYVANEYLPEHNAAMQANIQVRILRILGKLGGSNVKLISDGKDNESKNIKGQKGDDEFVSKQESQTGVSWDTTKRISLDLPHQSGNLKIYLDDLLPVLTKLASSSSNRQAKISACEFVHAVTLNMTNQDSGNGDYEAIYQHLFPLIVSLSTDVEKITRQLFEPLTFHLIKWSIVTGSDKAALILLHALTDALTSETDGGLRTFAATSLTQYLRLFFDLKRSRSVISTLFSLLHSLACHPNPYKRLGSITAFQQLVVVFNEYKTSSNFDHSLINILEITNSIFSALQLMKSEHESIGVEAPCVQLTESLAALIEHFGEILYPYGLSMFVTNLFTTCCGHIRKSVRLCAQRLFLKVVRLLPEHPTASTWLMNHLEGHGDIYDVHNQGISISQPTTSKLKRRSSGSMDSQSSSQSSSQNESATTYSFKPTKSVSLDVFESTDMQLLLEKCKKCIEQSSSLSNADCIRWFKGLTAWLESIYWLVANKIINPSMLTKTGSENAVFAHSQIFLSSYALMDLKSGIFLQMTPAETEVHTQARCETTLSIYNLAILLMDHGSLIMNQDALYRVLIVTMLAPTLLGFQIHSIQDHRRIRKYTSRMLNCILRNLSNCHSSNVAGQATFKRFNTITANLINRMELNISSLSYKAGEIDVEKMRHVAIGLYDMSTFKLLEIRYKNYDKLAPLLLQNVFENHSDCSPLEIQAFGKVMKLALHSKFDVQVLFELLKNDEPATKSGQAAPLQISMEVDHVTQKDQTANQQKKVTTKGELFYLNFKKQIDEFLALHLTTCIEPLISLVSSTHPHMFKIVMSLIDRHINEIRIGHSSSQKNANFLNTISSALLTKWIGPESTYDQRDLILEYIRKLLIIDSKWAFADERCQNFILTAFKNFMARDQQLSFKNRVLGLLSSLLINLPKDKIEDVIKCVNSMVVFDFPTKSTLLSPESTSYSDYISSLDILLQTLASTHSIELLETLFPILNESNHTYIVQIDKSLEQFVRSMKTIEDCRRLADLCIRTFMDPIPNLECLRLSLMRKVIVPLILSMKKEFCVEIIGPHVSTLFGLVFPVLPEIATPKPDSKPPIIDRLTIVSRIGAFHVIQAIFQAIDASGRDRLNGLITIPKDVKANSISQKAMRCAFAVRNNKHGEISKEVPPELVLDYQVTAYNALATALMKVEPSNEKFFQVFGFKEDLEKGDLLWEHIIDLRATYTFAVETNFPIASKQVTAIYSKAAQKILQHNYPSTTSASQLLDSPALGVNRNQKNLLSPNYFLDSSLSQDVSNSAFFVSNESLNKDAVPTTNEETMDVDQESSQSSNSQTEIELDPLNYTPCMFNMMDMIDDIVVKFPNSFQAEEMPKWMIEIYDKYTNVTTHLNIKLFITKLIMNKQEVFEKYADWWFVPLCKILIHNMSTVGTPGFNYFVRDLVIMFLKWNSFVPHEAEQKRFAGQLVEYLMKNATHSSRQVIISNMQIIKLLVERWKDILVNQIPRKLIYESLTLERKSPRASRFYRLVGIQLLGCIITNQIGLWNDSSSSQISKVLFYDGIVALLSYSSKEVYDAAGELIGLAFAHQTSGADDDFHQLVVDKLTALFNSEELSKFINILEKISRHYPSIVDIFIVRVLTSLKKLADLKAKALEIVYLRITDLDDPYASLINNLESLIKHRDDATQTTTLNILHIIFESIPTKDIQSFLLPCLSSSFSNHSNETIRSLYYGLLMKFIESRPELADHEPLRLALLKGLADPSLELSQSIFDFWDTSDRLSNQPELRLNQLMDRFYHPDIEGQWLKLSTNLLLRVFQRHKAFENAISTQPKGTEGHGIDFDDTMALMGIMEPSASNYVKQTLSNSQDMDSSPVKATNKTQHFSTYHSVYFDTNINPSMEISEPQSPSSKAKSAQRNSQQAAEASDASLMPPPKTPPRPRAPAKMMSPPSSVLDSLDGNLSHESKVRVMRRFVNSPSSQMGSSHFFRQRELALRKRREAQAREISRKRLHNVQILRQYKQSIKSITTKDIIDPLISVALRNDIISRMVLVILVSSMTDQLDASFLQSTVTRLLEASLSGSSSNDQSDSANKSVNSLETISTPFINCLFRIAHDHPSLILPSKLIADSAIKSMNFHLGIITLEKQIIKFEQASNEPQPLKTRRRSSAAFLNTAPVASSSNKVSSALIDDTWAQLVRLYKILDEQDILQGLYAKPSLTSNQSIKKALAWELEGSFEQASSLYKEILEHSKVLGEQMEVDQEQLTENELQMVESGQLNCLSKLSDWNQIATTIYNKMSSNSSESIDSSVQQTFKVIGGNDPISLIWLSNNKEKYMKYFLTSCLMEKDKWDFLFEWMNINENKKASLESNLSPELAFLSVLRNDIGKADYYVRQGYRSFLSSWSVLPPSMAKAAQKQLLQQVQPLVELEEFLTFVTSNIKANLSIENMNKLLLSWRPRFPNQKLDDFENWEKLCKQRAQYLQLICAHFIQRKEMEKSSSNRNAESVIDINQIRKTLQLERDHLYIKMSIAARKQGRYSNADAILKMTEAKVPQGKKGSFFAFYSRIKTDLSILKHDALKSRGSSSQNTPSVTKEMLLKYSELLSLVNLKDSEISEFDFTKKTKLNSLQSRLFVDLYELENNSTTQFNNTLKSLPPQARESLSKVNDGSLIEHCKSTFNKILESATASKNVDVIAKTYYKLSSFCDQVVESSKTPVEMKSKLILEVVVQMFNSIKLGNQRAIGSIPRLLKLLSSTRYSASSKKPESASPKLMQKVGTAFTKFSQEIPVWIWLRWTNQLFGLMDHPEFEYILPIIEMIGEKYPQSIYYHFRISTDKDFGTAPVPQRLQKLSRLLHHDVLDKFVNAMEQMTNPEHRAKSWISALKSSLSNKPLLNKVYWAMVQDCMICTSDTGSLNRSFANKITMREFTERGGEGLPPVDNALLEKVNKRINEVIKSFSESDKANTLSHYSMWLDNYSSSLGMKLFELEVPGQYTGFHKPQPEEHVKVSSFDKSLLIMASMRRPKRLKIRGTDEKEYWFLVKGGEDLRQDQRIEQFFEICNHLLRLETETSKRRLSIHTYNVIPMTTRAGILEWLRNTNPLKAVVEGGTHPGIKEASKIQNNWLDSHKPSGFKGDITESYKNAFKQTSRQELTSKLASQHEKIPGDLLRSKIIALSADPEAFLGIRQKSATSLAVFSIAAYIIGIGDRHLDNFLINMKDGEFIGIDFGYAFDSATLLVPIPEMVPFRLTRQMTNLLRPLDADGLLKLTMIHTMNALVKGKKLLMDAMDVFVNEPLLDWATYCPRLPNKPSIEEYTRDRINTVAQKLSMVDPGYLTSQILKVSIHHNTEYRKTFIKVLMPPNNQNYCTSVVEQVERLISQATDPFVLGVAWGGWCAWV